MEKMGRPRIREPLIIFLIVAGFFYWSINAFNTGNLLWFLPFQPTYEPSRIVVHNYGTTEILRPGMPEYARLKTALDETFSKFNNTALIDLGLSDETLRRYNEEQLVIEIYYPEFIRFNTPVRMTRVNQLLVPIDATHSGHGYVFLGSNGRWLAGAMVVADDEPLMEAMRELGYLKK
ncbi:MAG: hypothetical protein D6706_09645 [Chloroflexi bacterium]|nr:MAG: hypothetical protein D6706_09645 [Chloroflexota bacterium]